MSQNANGDFKKFFYENPFEKKLIFEKDNTSGSIQQNLIIHHKKNMRKSMLYNSKEDFDKDNIQKEKTSNLNENPINKDFKQIIQPGKKELNMNNLFFKKVEYQDEIKSQNNNNDKKVKNPSQNYNYIKIEEDYNEKKDINQKNEFFNPFNVNFKNSNENNIFNNPFKLRENPFKKNENDKINQINPFINLAKDNINNNLNKDTRINPFTKTESNIGNPFINNGNNKMERNPFLNNNGGNSNNPFLNNNDNKNKNPFLNSDSTNIFNFNNSDNIKNDSALNEKSDDEEELKKIQEEVKIEKDENKLKNFQDVKNIKSDKFFETEIENLQFLEREQGKNKYISKGSGIFSFQEEKDEKGKKIGIFTLRESATKNIKLQGIIIDSTCVEKSKLKNGLEFIFIKNILVKYSKYETEKMTEETKITFLRIRVKKEEIDNFYNKTNEFFNLIKK